jgi:hypothetical protein
MAGKECAVELDGLDERFGAMTRLREVDPAHCEQSRTMRFKPATAAARRLWWLAC